MNKCNCRQCGMQAQRDEARDTIARIKTLCESAGTKSPRGLAYQIVKIINTPSKPQTDGPQPMGLFPSMSDD